MRYLVVLGGIFGSKRARVDAVVISDIYEILLEYMNTSIIFLVKSDFEFTTLRIGRPPLSDLHS